jgi:predicted SAM-dependent methyltransferase
MNWTISDSPTCNPSVNPSVLQKYTKEQIDIANISMLVELLMRTDANFKEITPHGAERCLFQMKPDYDNDIINDNYDTKILFDGKEISIDTLKDALYKYYTDRIADKKAIDSALFHLQRYLMAIKHISNFGMNTGKVFEVGGKGVFTFFMTSLLEIKEIMHVDHDLRKPLTCNMDNSCDSIICMEVFEHIKDLGEQYDFCFDGVMNALKTFWKILKPNGLMLLTTPNICGTLSLNNILKHKNAIMYPKHNREYTITELYRIFNSVGFKIELLKTEYVFRPHIANDMLKIFAAHGYSTDYRGDDIVAVLRKPESGTFLNSNIADIILEINR